MCVCVCVARSLSAEGFTVHAAATVLRYLFPTLELRPRFLGSLAFFEPSSLKVSTHFNTSFFSHP